MAFYRFMSTKYIDDTLSGKIRFGRFHYYRMFECLYDDWIGDSQDGVTTSITGYLDFKDGNVSEEMQEKLRVLGAHIPNGASVELDGLTVLHDCDGFILSFSRGEYDDLKARMANDEYDACVRFESIDLIAKCIYENGIIPGCGKVSDYFHPPEVGDVQYGVNTAFVENDDILGFNPLLKRQKYAGQQESRIVFSPIKDFPGDFLSIEVQFPEGSLMEEFRYEGPPKSRVESDKFDDPLQFLREIRSELVRSSIEDYDAYFKLSNEEKLKLHLDNHASKMAWLNSDGRKKKVAHAYWQLRNSDKRYVDYDLEWYFYAYPYDWHHLAAKLQLLFIKAQERQ